MSWASVRASLKYSHDLRFWLISKNDVDSQNDDMTALSEASSMKSYDCLLDTHSSRKKRPASSHDAGPSTWRLLPDMCMQTSAHNAKIKFFSGSVIFLAIMARMAGM